MKFIVSGGGGFIGSHVVDLLIATGADVYVVDNFSTGRVTNVNAKANLIQSFCVDISLKFLEQESTVIHLAAQPQCNVSLFMPEQDAMNNYLPGLKFLIKCMEARVRRFVFVSSMSVYGDAAPLPYREEMAPLPRDPYAIHKWALERICLTQGQVHGVEVVIVRPQHVFGPRQRSDFAHRNVIARWIRRALLGQPLPVIGTLKLRRAFSPVSLVARGIVAGATKDEAAWEIFNLGSRNIRSLKEIADKLASHLKIALEMSQSPPPPTLLQESYGDVGKSEKFLGIYEEDDEFDNNLKELIQEISQSLDDHKELELQPEILKETFCQTYGA